MVDNTEMQDSIDLVVQTSKSQVSEKSSHYTDILTVPLNYWMYNSNTNIKVNWQLPEELLQQQLRTVLKRLILSYGQNESKSLDKRFIAIRQPRIQASDDVKLKSLCRTQIPVVWDKIFPDKLLYAGVLLYHVFNTQYNKNILLNIVLHSIDVTVGKVNDSTLYSQSVLDVMQFIQLFKALHAICDVSVIGDVAEQFYQLRNIAHIQPYNTTRLEQMYEQVQSWFLVKRTDVIELYGLEYVTRFIDSVLQERYDFSVHDEKRELLILQPNKFLKSGKALGEDGSKTNYYSKQVNQWAFFANKQLNDNKSKVYFRCFVKPEPEKARLIVTCDNTSHFQLNIVMEDMKGRTITEAYFAEQGRLKQQHIINKWEQQLGLKRSLDQKTFDRNQSWALYKLILIRYGLFTPSNVTKMAIKNWQSRIINHQDAWIQYRDAQNIDQESLIVWGDPSGTPLTTKINSILNEVNLKICEDQAKQQYAKQLQLKRSQQGKGGVVDDYEEWNGLIDVLIQSDDTVATFGNYDQSTLLIDKADELGYKYKLPDFASQDGTFEFLQCLYSPKRYGLNNYVSKMQVGQLYRIRQKYCARVLPKLVFRSAQSRAEVRQMLQQKLDAWRELLARVDQPHNLRNIIAEDIFFELKSFIKPRIFNDVMKLTIKEVFTSLYIPAFLGGFGIYPVSFVWLLNLFDWNKRAIDISLYSKRFVRLVIGSDTRKDKTQSTFSKFFHFPSQLSSKPKNRNATIKKLASQTYYNIFRMLSVVEEHEVNEQDFFVCSDFKKVFQKYYDCKDVLLTQFKLHYDVVNQSLPNSSPIENLPQQELNLFGELQIINPAISHYLVKKIRSYYQQLNLREVISMYYQFWLKWHNGYDWQPSFEFDKFDQSKYAYINTWKLFLYMLGSKKTNLPNTYLCQDQREAYYRQIVNWYENKLKTAAEVIDLKGFVTDDAESVKQKYILQIKALAVDQAITDNHRVSKQVIYKYY